MTERERPMLRLRLHGGPFEPGEPPLGDLARLGEDTQAVARCFGRMVAGRPGLTRLSAAVPSATQLKLVGLEAVGDATVLDLAGVDAPAGGLLGDALPLDLGARALFAFVDSLTALTEELPDLPDGFDDETRYGLDIWLRRVRRFGRVVVSVSFGATARGCELEPVAARERLALLDVPPHESLVPATRHAIEGVLYALNLHTGTYAVEDDHGQRIRLTVPPEMRPSSAALISRRIRAEGAATIDDQGRLHLLSVAGLLPAHTVEQPSLAGIPDAQPRSPAPDQPNGEPPPAEEASTNGTPPGNGAASDDLDDIDVMALTRPEPPEAPAPGVIAGAALDDDEAMAQLTRQAEDAARRLADLGHR